MLFLEGRRTEPGYIQHYHRLHRDRVLITIDDFHGNPTQLVEHAIQAKKHEQREERRGGGKPPDAIWCVFDVDEHPGQEDAIHRAQQHGINIAVSNPCLELWFILHFEDQTAYIDRKQATRRAKELLGCAKTLTDEALRSLGQRHEDAVKRAKLLDQKHQGDGSPPRSNPSSDIWRLIDCIRP